MTGKQNHLLASFFIFITFASIISLYIPKSMAAHDDVVVIPNEAIRLRILANSNSEQDQEIKRKVRDLVNAQITEWVEQLTSLEEARQVIQTNLPEVENIAREILQEEKVNQSVHVDFDRVAFPTKLYGNFLYPAGEYEAILITIGEGTGANWWCVLFPPLCFLDFSSGSAVSDGFEDSHVDKKDEQQKKKSVDKVDSKNNKENKLDKEMKSSNSLFVEEKEEKTEVKFFLFELIDKILSIFK
ncbi:stage II sporulation protein R [Bacillus kwashiorkori]|uniref:stage II sporulation protein R n=1 Tax=Bacillus kwashiorkori TaxID=1522318 RepID=UPI00078294F9|nr:stage II sporulation protein R [Bacillus kwashiorkori]